MSKDEIEKKTFNHKKYKYKITIKRMMIKFK
jgi:hypothetical protein